MIILSSFTIFKAVQPFAAQMEGHLYIPITHRSNSTITTTDKPSCTPRTPSRMQNGSVQIKLQKGDDEPIENHNIIKSKIQCKNKNCIYRKIKNQIQ